MTLISKTETKGRKLKHKQRKLKQKQRRHKERAGDRGWRQGLETRAGDIKL